MPPNFAAYFLSMVSILLLFPALHYGDQILTCTKQKYVESVLEQPISQGWSNLEKYYSSDIRKSYSDGEFPVTLVSIGAPKNGYVSLNFEVYNKTANPLRVSTDNEGAKGDIEFFASVTVEPMSKAPIAAKI